MAERLITPDPSRRVPLSCGAGAHRPAAGASVGGGLPPPTPPPIVLFRRLPVSPLKSTFKPGYFCRFGRFWTRLLTLSGGLYLPARPCPCPC